MDVRIPDYCKMLSIMTLVHTDAEKHAILSMLTAQEMMALERDIVTYKVVLKKALREELESVALVYTYQQLNEYDITLCHLAYISISKLLPTDSDLRRLVGNPDDYSALELCIDLRNSFTPIQGDDKNV